MNIVDNDLDGDGKTRQSSQDAESGMGIFAKKCGLSIAELKDRIAQVRQKKRGEVSKRMRKVVDGETPIVPGLGKEHDPREQHTERRIRTRNFTDDESSPSFENAVRALEDFLSSLD